MVLPESVFRLNRKAKLANARRLENSQLSAILVMLIS